MSMCTSKHVDEYAMGVSILCVVCYLAKVSKHLGVLILLILSSFSLFRSRPSWALLGALLGRSWRPLGVLFGPCWGPLGGPRSYFGAILGPLGGVLGGSWGAPGGGLGGLLGGLEIKIT